jgi:phage-related protein
MTGEVILNGVSSKTLKLHVTQLTAYDDPERDVSEIEVPGRNGSLFIDNGRYKNKSIGYHFSSDDFSQINSFKSWAGQLKNNYKRIEDSYNPDVYISAMLTGPIEFTKIIIGKMYAADITFTRKPQKFLKTGETPVTISAEGTITNPTLEYAKPLITVTGTGVLSVNGTIVTINKNETTITLDCEAEDAYTGVENKNGDIYIDDFPTLQPGVNAIIPADKMTVEITPRWWRL